MIALDTNILVYAHRSDSPWHTEAVAALTKASTGLWAIPWPCIHEFFSTVTHPRIFDPPTPVAKALATLDEWLKSPTLKLLHETDDSWLTLKAQLTKAKISGPKVHDARIVTLCLEHGIEELWTADRDFSRFGDLVTCNPLAKP